MAKLPFYDVELAPLPSSSSSSSSSMNHGSGPAQRFYKKRASLSLSLSFPLPSPVPVPLIQSAAANSPVPEHRLTNRQRERGGPGSEWANGKPEREGKRKKEWPMRKRRGRRRSKCRQKWREPASRRGERGERRWVSFRAGRMRAAHGGLWAALALLLLLLLLPAESHGLREGDCEVCVSFLGRFYQSLRDNNAEFTPNSIEKELLKSCKETKGKENRLCYYIGATSDAATKMINEVSKPLSNHIPVEKICEKLKKKDSQICELKYDKQIDLSTVDLKKLRVKELKKILDDWGETCKGCAEKSDYIRKINELMPKYAPKAASSRTDL
ncbi:hypothetical protein JRQ81_002867 [Phrynocephalus forsythii]|uniref:Mesencephalic astrocyte-derived neurotrophic factor n=1 Tax=Phrynocephalus forsythii TaxID=171643 RepID=A0A9Q0XKP4_9SAUR|nr:hypothetical protein JRQ81_002867 [Phrynocephalus forsythii]